MEKIKLTVSELNEISCGDSSDFAVMDHKITGTFRHGNENTAVVKRVSDGKFFEVSYRDSVKDECEFMDMNSGGEYPEVVPQEKTITIYVPAP
jgi:hypothetical protein